MGAHCALIRKARGLVLFAVLLAACSGGGGGGDDGVSGPLALLFSASDGTAGQELWKTDGTAAGTTLVKDINVGAANSSPLFLTPFNGALYFLATDSTSGAELWKTDRTAAGTVMVKDINPGAAGSFPLGLGSAVFNGALYFTAADAFGSELWKTDGTDAGTVRVSDLVAGAGGSSPFQFTVFNGALYFVAFSAPAPDFDDELWKTDGTNAGTVRVKDINPGAVSSSPFGLAIVNSTLVFRANDGVSGSELWKTDGTSAGTVLLKDINPGASGSLPFSSGAGTLFNGALYFAV